MTTDIFNLPADEATWRPAVFPGDGAARQQGCTCPAQIEWPGKLVFDDACPIHTVADRIEWRRYLCAKEGPGARS